MQGRLNNMNMAKLSERERSGEWIIKDIKHSPILSEGCSFDNASPRICAASSLSVKKGDRTVA